MFFSSSNFFSFQSERIITTFQLYFPFYFYLSLFLPFWFFLVYQSIPLYLFLLINHLIYPPSPLFLFPPFNLLFLVSWLVIWHDAYIYFDYYSSFLSLHNFLLFHINEYTYL